MWKRTLALAVAVIAISPRTAPRSARADEAATGNYSAAELKELVAPVALYPDVVIASLLPSTTFPADITAAAGVIAQNGGAVSEVPAGVTWDPSVQTLLQFPDVLVWLKDNPDWVAQMGFAIAVQQSEVMAAIQAFRLDCKNAGNLNSDTHQTVSTQDATDGGGAEVIVIEPSDPAVVYVPTYSPTAVVQPGYAYPWGAGFAMGVAGAWAYNNINWGSNGGDINVNRNTNINTGNVNVGNNVGPNRGSKWNASNKPAARPNGAVNKPKQGNWGSAGGKPKGGGVKPRAQGAGAGGGAANRPGGGAKPSTRPNAGGAGGAGGARPSAPSSRPAAKPSAPSRPPSAVGGAGSGASTRASSDRGASSLNRSGGGSSGSASRGQSGRSSGGGGGGGGRSSGGGGGRGGGGGGGGRRR